MSKQQQPVDAVYTYIKQRIDDQQGSPTQQEIAETCQLSIGTVGRLLEILEAQGQIIRVPFKSRGIRLAQQKTANQKNEIAETVYKYLVQEIQWGDVPSQQEIADACLLSRSEVQRALLWLEAQARIERVDGHRNIRLVEG
ncbi:MAG: hypothetical protein WBC91_14970 [Phototrophicaceae bacterium]